MKISSSAPVSNKRTKRALHYLLPAKHDSVWSLLTFLRYNPYARTVTIGKPIDGSGVISGSFSGEIVTTLNECGYDSSKHNCDNTQVDGWASPILTIEGLDQGFLPVIKISELPVGYNVEMLASVRGRDYYLEFSHSSSYWIVWYCDFAIYEPRDALIARFSCDDYKVFSTRPEAQSFYDYMAAHVGTREACAKIGPRATWTIGSGKLNQGALPTPAGLYGVMERLIDSAPAQPEIPYQQRIDTWAECFESIQDLETLGICFDVWTGGLIADNADKIFKNLSNASKQNSVTHALRKNLKEMTKNGELTSVQHAGANYLINLRDYGSTVNAVKAVSNAKLGVSWGIIAPLRDYVDMHNTLADWYKTDPKTGKPIGMKPFWEVAHGAKSSLQYGDDWSGYFAVTTEYKPEGPATNWGSALALCCQAGFVPSWEKFWDVVPFSFAINWAANVEEYFKRKDAHRWANIVPLKTGCETFRLQKHFECSEAGWYIRGEIIRYKRTYIPTANIPRSFQSKDYGSYKGTCSIQNIDEMAALVISYI